MATDEIRSNHDARVLLIEDDPADVRLIRELLHDGKAHVLAQHVATVAAGLERLRSDRFDAVLLDLSLPDGQGLDTFSRIYAARPDIAVVVLSGLDDEQLALGAVHAGAQDYLVKGRVDGALLARALHHAIERKRVENALAESSARFRQVFAESPVGIVVVDIQRDVVESNQAFCEMLDYTPAELAKLSFVDYTHPDDLAVELPRLEKLIRGETPSYTVDKRYVRKDGSYVWGHLSASVIRHPDGSPLYGIGIIEDTDARRRAEERIRRSETLLREAQHIARLGSWEWDVVADRIGWSEEMFHIFGIVGDQPPADSAHYLDVVHPDDRSAVNETFDKALVDHRPFDVESRIVRPDGTVRTVHLRAEVVLGDESRVVRMVGVCQDVTESRQIQIELEQARDAALRSARLKSAFIENMSHEIRTPLNIILGNIDLVSAADAELDAVDREQNALAMRRAADRLVTTVDGILDMSQLETGNFEVKPQWLAPEYVLRGAVAAIEPQAQEKGIGLALRIEERGATVWFDEYCLRRALDNLLCNALKFTTVGEIEVRLWRTAADELAIDVRDTGIGIEPTYLSHVFEAFSQEDVGTTRRFEGSGIGLFLTRAYLERNGARISVESEKGSGSLFRIHLRSLARPAYTADSVRDEG